MSREWFHVLTCLLPSDVAMNTQEEISYKFKESFCDAGTNLAPNTAPRALGELSPCFCQFLTVFSSILNLLICPRVTAPFHWERMKSQYSTKVSIFNITCTKCASVWSRWIITDPSDLPNVRRTNLSAMAPQWSPLSNLMLTGGILGRGRFR